MSWRRCSERGLFPGCRAVLSGAAPEPVCGWRGMLMFPSYSTIVSRTGWGILMRRADLVDSTNDSTNANVLVGRSYSQLSHLDCGQLDVSLIWGIIVAIRRRVLWTCI